VEVSVDIDLKTHTTSTPPIGHRVNCFRCLAFADEFADHDESGCDAGPRRNAELFRQLANRFRKSRPARAARSASSSCACG